MFFYLYYGTIPSVGIMVWYLVPAGTTILLVQVPAVLMLLYCIHILPEEGTVQYQYHFVQTVLYCTVLYILDVCFGMEKKKKKKRGTE